MTTPFNFEEKIALIAGGTGGLGSVLRSELEAKGCVVVTVSRTQTNEPSHITADLRSPEASTAVVTEVINRLGKLDIVINAMGVVALGI